MVKNMNTFMLYITAIDFHATAVLFFCFLEKWKYMKTHEQAVVGIAWFSTSHIEMRKQ